MGMTKQRPAGTLNSNIATPLGWESILAEPSSVGESPTVHEFVNEIGVCLDEETKQLEAYYDEFGDEDREAVEARRAAGMRGLKRAEQD